ncbi:hypothetical protein bcere0021_23320 [Bacillus cereus Rock3-42]|nr:hypothetical protein BC059799_2487 [Bacillus cereus NVH0597-99]EEL45564.1 hypothetical protein bcere0021_23320 [Bacillus cereus Rock3-42]
MSTKIFCSLERRMYSLFGWIFEFEKKIVTSACSARNSNEEVLQGAQHE